MGPLRIDPKAALDEVARYGQKLTAATQVLRQVDDVHYGATEKKPSTAKTNWCCIASRATRHRPTRRRS